MRWKLAPSLKPLAAMAFGDMRRIFGLLMLIGILGALTGAAFLFVMKWLDALLGPGAWSLGVHVAVMAAVGLLVALITKLLGSPGSVELLVDNIHVLGGSEGIRDLRSLLPISLLCIGAGGGAGPEAPLVQTTGSIGSYLADRWKMTQSEKRVLTITGMAAGFTVLFGTPLGAAIFALEILHRKGMEYYEALIPAVLGSLCGYGVFSVLKGQDLTPVWNFGHMNSLRSIDLLWALGAGIAAAAVAVIFTYLNVALHRLFKFLPTMSRPVIGGVLLGLLAFLSPYALTFGERQIGDLPRVPPPAATQPQNQHAETFESRPPISPLTGTRPEGESIPGRPELPLAMGVLAVAAVAKLLGTSVTVSSGWRGGFIIPLFFIGAVLGQLCHQAFPHSNQLVLMAALMAAINTGVTKTPLGSTIVISEMAGLQLLPTTLIASVVALLLTSEVGLIESQRSRTGANGGREAHHHAD